VGNAATGNVNGWGNYQIGGGAGNQSAAYLDGAPVNVSYVNSTILVPTQDFVQEFRVVTNDVSPEFGRFAGGIINMSTRSGTNSIHGVLYITSETRILTQTHFSTTKPARPPMLQYGNAPGGGRDR
jgi:hypothetical protein